ncbi:MAG: hypothetical protein ACLVG6_11425 [Dorea formicigenerans]
MNTIICLTETPVWHQGYIKHHLRNPSINITGSFKGNRLIINDIYEILFINPVGIYSNDELFANCILDLTDGKCSEAVNSFIEQRMEITVSFLEERNADLRLVMQSSY